MTSKKLSSNREFQKTVSEDRELRELLHTPEAGVQETQLETLVAIGDSVLIHDMVFPAHTLGTLSSLSAIGHPLITGSGDGLTVYDILIALYLLKERENALALLLRLKTESIGEAEIYDSIDEVLPLPESWDYMEAAEDLMQVFNVSGGFAVMQQGGDAPPAKAGENGEPEVDGSAATAFDADYLASITALIASAYPALTPFEIIWRMPYPQAGFLTLQALRRSGVKGLDKRMKTVEAWQRFKALMGQFTDGGSTNP